MMGTQHFTDLNFAISSISYATKLTTPSLHSSYYSVWSRNIVTHSTTIEKHGCISSLVSASHTTISWRDRISRGLQPLLTRIIRTTLLKFLGHIARADPSSVAPLPRNCNHRSGQTRQTWI